MTIGRVMRGVLCDVLRAVLVAGRAAGASGWLGRWVGCLVGMGDSSMLIHYTTPSPPSIASINH